MLSSSTAGDTVGKGSALVAVAGAVVAAGVAVDAQDHVWVVQRPKTLTDDEKAASFNPPRTKCCVPAPPVMEFDSGGNLIKAWGGKGEGYDWPSNVRYANGSGMYSFQADAPWLASRTFRYTNEVSAAESPGMLHSHMHEACQHAFLGLGRLHPACAVLPRLLPIRRTPLFRMQSPAVRSLWSDDATITQFCVLCHIGDGVTRGGQCATQSAQS